MREINHWINGKNWDRPPARRGEVYDPASGQVQATVAYADVDEVDAAVAAARDAFGAWRATPLSKRTEILFAFRELVHRHRDDLARLVTAEHGKLVTDAAGEVSRGLEVIEFACGIPHLLKGEFSEEVSGGVDTHSLRQPLGVCAGITPFNFPAMVPMWMYPIAIACGNTFVLKPSEKDPSAANLSAELFREAGLPDGVLNVVHGDRVAVDRLLEHPDVAAVSFVGSTPVARHIYEAATSHGKRVQALGGAKNHMVVLPDADMDLAADAAVGAAYGSAGERCMAVSAVVAVGDAGDRLVGELSRRINDLRTGPGDDPDAEMGPLVTGPHRDKVAGYVEAGIREGADLVVDGRDLAVPGHEDGFFLGPCLFDRVTPEMSIYQNEIFGPVLVVVRADTYEDAVELVNANPYGNGTAVFTNNGGAARRFAGEVQIGMVGVNAPIPVPMAFYSFGGWKSSLFGDLHIHGPDGVRFYTRGKVVVSRWPSSTPEKRGVDLGFPTNR